MFTPVFRRFVEDEVFAREPLEYAANSYDSVSVTWSETEAITAQLDDIYDLSMAEGPIEAMTENHLRYFADQPTVLPPDQAPILGWTVVAEFYSAILQGIQIVENNYTDLSIVVLGDMAIRRYLGTGVFRVTGLADPQTAVNRYVDVLIMVDGKWKTLVHSWESAKLE